MSIDNPLDALQKQLDSEERSTDPVLKRILDLLSSLPLSWPVDKGIRRLMARMSADRIEKIELTLGVVRAELQRHEAQVREIGERLSGQATKGPSQQQTQQHLEEWLTLVMDGLKKAEQTRAKTRVTRIGKILANAFVRFPILAADDVEEMMRVAMELSDREIEMLNELVRVQGKMLVSGRLERYQAWTFWEDGPWGARINAELDSVFSKLESFGLVTRLAPPNNLNITADFQNHYGLLGKGAEFIKFIQSQ